MSKLPPTSANIRFVADTLAKIRNGARDQVTLADVRVTIAGTADLIEPHFQAWLAGNPPPEGEARLIDVIGDLERRLVGAIRDGGASRAPARVTATAVAAAQPQGRAATSEELRAVVLAALSGPEPEAGRTFLTDVWDKAQALRVRPVRTVRSGPRRKRPYTRPPPDVPKAVRRDRAAGRLAAIKASAFAGLSPTGEPPGRPPRRVLKADWTGARNVFFARHAAAALRNAGHPMIPSELVTHIAARGGPSMRRPDRDVMAQLAGSPMVRVGRRCLIWFADETPPPRPKRSTRRDTPEALARELAKRLFAKVLDCIREAGREGISLKQIRSTLGPELADFNRDWLEQRLKRAASVPSAKVRKIPGGYEWVAQERLGRAGRR